MKKNTRSTAAIIAITLLILILLSSATVMCVGRKLKIAVSIEPLALIVKEIVGEYGDVVVLLPPGVEPHEFQLTREVIDKVKGCDLIVHTGHCGFELKLVEVTGIRDLGLRDFIRYGLKLKPLPGREVPTVVPKGKSALELSAMGYNVHGWWLDPDNAIAVARALVDTLSEIDPEHSRYYRTRFEMFLEEIKELKEFLSEVSTGEELIGRSVVVVAPSTQYLLECLGMRVDAVLSIGTVTAGGKTLSDIVSGLKSGAYCALIAPEICRYTKLGDYATSLSRETGVPLIYLNVVEVKYARTYVQYVMYNVVKLVTEMKVSGTGRVGAQVPLLHIVLLACLSIVIVIETMLIIRLRRVR